MSENAARCDVWSPADRTGTPFCPPRRPRFVDRYGAPWLVRPVEETDREPLLEMYRDFDPARRAQGLPPLEDARLEAWVDGLLDEGRNFVAAREGRVVGHAAYTPADAAEPELVVFVHRDAARRGLGTELCRHVVATAAANDREGLVLEVSQQKRTAVGIYERLGFERIERAEPGGAGIRTSEIGMRLTFPASVDSDLQRSPAVGTDRGTAG